MRAHDTQEAAGREGEGGEGGGERAGRREGGGGGESGNERTLNKTPPNKRMQWRMAQASSFITRLTRFVSSNGMALVCHKTAKVLAAKLR